MQSSELLADGGQVGTLYFFCGKMASGKTTLATRLALKPTTIYVSEDELLAGLFPGEVHDIPDYVRCTDRLKTTLSTHFVAVLKQGVSLVLDFPANTRKQRQWMRSLIDSSGASHELHFLNYSDDYCKRQLQQRISSSTQPRSTDTLEMFNRMSRYFEPPAADEEFTLVEHTLADN
ncbi:MAG: ATP-binding protein [Gammaproteobacteria bacterium]|nr:ATP-binding protein [Gammaproteobacteria bacterium]